MNLEEAKKILFNLEPILKRLSDRNGYMLRVDELDYDYENLEEKFEINLLYNVFDKLDEIKDVLEYIQKEVFIEGHLTRNNQGRYEIDGTEHYFTSGNTIEFFYDNGWNKSRIEHNSSDYYIYHYKEVILEGLLVRVR